MNGISDTIAGNCDAKRGSIARTESTTCTVFAFGWRCTASVIERSPLYQLAVFTDSKLSCTSATSRSRTGAPLRVATTMFANSRAFTSWRFACTVSVCRGPSSTPTGVFALAAPMAARSSSSVRLRSLSWSLRTRTRTAKRFWPKMPTCATPSTVDRLGEIRFSA